MSQAVTQQLRTSGAYANKPLDERATVATFEQLQTNFPGAYVGLHIYVEDRQTEYVVTKLDGTDIDMEQGLIPLEEFINANPNSVLYTEQTLTNAQKAQARQNIGAGTSDFSGNYNDLSNKPNIPDVSNKVDKEEGKGLSTNDYDNIEKAKVANAIQTPTADENDKIPVMRNGSIEWEARPSNGQDGAQGPKGDPGHNPCLGRLNVVPADFDIAFPDAIAGDYVYADIYDSTTQTTTTTIYHYVDDTNGWDSGTVIDAEHPTFASNQPVTAVHIKDENGDDDSNAQGVLSAKAGKNLHDSILGTDDIPLDIANGYTQHQGIINPNNGNWNSVNQNNIHIAIPVEQGQVYEVVGRPLSKVTLYFCSAHTVTNAQSASVIEVWFVAKNTTVEKQVPAGATYLIVQLLTEGTSNPPTSVTLKGSKGLIEEETTFASGQSVKDVNIVNNTTDGGANNALSAEAGKELNQHIGDLASLNTTEKSSLVGSINNIVGGGEDTPYDIEELLTNKNAGTIYYNSTQERHNWSAEAGSYYVVLNVNKSEEYVITSSKVIRAYLLSQYEFVAGSSASVVRSWGTNQSPLEITVEDGEHYLVIIVNTPAANIAPSSIVKKAPKGLIPATVTEIGDDADDDHVPTAKAVKDLVDAIPTPSANTQEDINATLLGIEDGVLDGLPAGTTFDSTRKTITIPVIGNHTKLHLTVEFKFRELVDYGEGSYRQLLRIGGNSTDVSNAFTYLFGNRLGNISQYGFITNNFSLTANGDTYQPITPSKFNAWSGPTAFAIRYKNLDFETAGDIRLKIDENGIYVERVENRQTTTLESILFSSLTNTKVSTLVDYINGNSDYIEVVAYEVLDHTVDELIHNKANRQNKSIQFALIRDFTKAGAPSSYKDTPWFYIKYEQNKEWHTCEIVVDTETQTSYMAVDGITVGKSTESTQKAIGTIVLGDDKSSIVNYCLKAEWRNLHIHFDSWEDAEVISNLAPGTTTTTYKTQLISNINPKLLIFEAHKVVDSISETDTNGLNTSTDRLYWLFNKLKESGYQPVSMNDIIEWKKRGGSLPKRCYAIVMDDYYVENMLDNELQMPFKQYGVQGVLSIAQDGPNTTQDWLPNKQITIDGATYTYKEAVDICWRNGWFCADHLENMGLNDVKAPKVSELPDYLKDRVRAAYKCGVNTEVLVYPLGQFDQAISAVSNSDYSIAVMTDIPEYNCKGLSDWCLQRHTISYSVSLNFLKQIIN